jgi:hypothetical protein
MMGVGAPSLEQVALAQKKMAEIERRRKFFGRLQVPRAVMTQFIYEDIAIVKDQEECHA